MSQPPRRRDRQVVRILATLGALIEGAQPSVRDLAAQFGTRRETIYRDLKALEDAGYAVVGDESGRLSNPRLLPEDRRRAPELRLTDTEIAGLLWSAKQSGAGSPFSDSIDSAVGKLEAMAAQGNRALSAGMLGVMSEGGLGPKDYAPHKATILRLVEAIIRRRRCAVRYQSPTSQAPKKYSYDAYRLLTVNGSLYCIGQVPPNDNIATLAVDRIQSLTITEEEFEVDPAFDAERHSRESFGVIWEEPQTVVVRFSAEQAPYVRERQWHPSQQIHDLNDGRIEVTLCAGGIYEITRWVLGWGDAAEVVSPLELRRNVRETLNAALGIYRDAD
jgi:proteasome accessory factor B